MKNRLIIIAFTISCTLLAVLQVSSTCSKWISKNPGPKNEVHTQFAVNALESTFRNEFEEGIYRNLEIKDVRWLLFRTSSDGRIAPHQRLGLTRTYSADGVVTYAFTDGDGERTIEERSFVYSTKFAGSTHADIADQVWIYLGS